MNHTTAHAHAIATDLSSTGRQTDPPAPPFLSRDAARQGARAAADAPTLPMVPACCQPRKAIAATAAAAARQRSAPVLGEDGEPAPPAPRRFKVATPFPLAGYLERAGSRRAAWRPSSAGAFAYAWPLVAGALLALSGTAGTTAARAQLTAEPDLFPTGANITSLYPGLTLHNASPNGTTIGDVFSLTSGAPSTGSRVFSSGSTSGGNWFGAGGSTGNVLRADFAVPQASVTLDFIGNDFPDVGLLQAFNGSGVLLISGFTPTLGANQIFAVTVTVPGIAYILAGGNSATGDDIVLDNLRTGAVPEPSIWAMALGGLGALVLLQRRGGRRGMALGLAVLGTVDLATPAVRAQERVVNGSFELGTGAPTGWTTSNGDGSVSRLTGTNSPFTGSYPAGNAVAQFADGNVTNNFGPRLQQTFASPAAPFLRIAYDFRLASLPGAGWTMLLGNDDGGGTSFLSNIQFDANSSHTFTLDLQPILTLTAGTWYHVQMNADFATFRFNGSVTPFGGTATTFANIPFTTGQPLLNSITVQDLTGGGQNGVLSLDNVSVQATVPEPSTTYMLGVIGAVALAWLARRRVWQA